jgi:hypothetical protein
VIYEAIELGQLGKPPCPDKYNTVSTLVCPGSTRLLLQISKQAVFVQLGIMPQGRGTSVGAVQWQEEEPFLPMIATLARKFDAVRVRNWQAGAEAQIFVSVS